MHGSDGWLCNLVVGSGLKVGIVGFYFDATKIVRSGDSGVFGLFPPNAGNCQNMTVTVLEGRGKLLANPTNSTSATPRSRSDLFTRSIRDYIVQA